MSSLVRHVLCYFGIHKWVYVSSKTAEWWAEENCPYSFRGCAVCKKGQVPYHNPSFHYYNGWEWRDFDLIDLFKCTPVREQEVYDKLEEICFYAHEEQEEELLAWLNKI